MKISVITVCLNAERTIGRTVESFLKQAHPDKELIVIDGLSRDRTADVVRGFRSDDIVLVSEADRGMYHAANKALALYTGEAVGMLNADDRFADADALSRIDGALAGADIVFGNLDFVAAPDAPSVVRRWRGSQFRKGSFRRGWMPAHPTFYVRRRVINSIGGYDTAYRIAADYDFMLRALELHRFRPAFIDAVLVEMMRGGQSTSGLRSSVLHNYEALQSRRRHLGAGFVDYGAFAKPLRKLSQFRLTRFLSSDPGAARVPGKPEARDNRPFV